MESLIKKKLAKVPESQFKEARIKKSISKIKNKQEFREKNKGKYLILICGDHRSHLMNLKKLKEIKDAIESKGIICVLGKDYMKRCKGARQKEITDEYLENPDLIVLVDGKGDGTREESSIIRKDNQLKKKTLFFFKYKTLNQLSNKIPEKKDFVSEFKYPIPYKSYKELKAYILFGVQHWVNYKINRKSDNRRKRK
jgi:hypothetical protein